MEVPVWKCIVGRDSNLSSMIRLELTKSICPAVWHLRLSCLSKPSQTLPRNTRPCRRRFHRAVLSLWPMSSQQDAYVCSSRYERLAMIMSVVTQSLKNVILIPSPISGILEVRKRWHSCRSRVLSHATARRSHKLGILVCSRISSAVIHVADGW